MNRCCLVGRLTADPDVIYTQNQLAICSCTLAVDRGISKEDREAGKQSADFIRLKFFGKTAENFGKFHSKGSQVAVEGRIQSGSYKNQNGDTVYTTDVVVDRFTFVGSKNDRQSAPQGTQGTYVPNQPQNDPQYDGFSQLDSEDIPF